MLPLELEPQPRQHLSFSTSSSPNTHLLPTTHPVPHTSSTSTVPESVFGWPALVLAVQSAVGSLRIFHRLPALGNAVASLPNSAATFPPSTSHMSVPCEPAGQENASVALSSGTANRMGSQTSTDITMIPASQSLEDITLQDPHSLTIQSASSSSSSSLLFTALPDELIAMCYADLSAGDLVTLEHVSLRLRHLIAYDSVCWKRCTENRWGHLSSNSAILAAAARHAGTWKHLYSEKARADKDNTPWLTLCKSETLAILDIIKGDNSVPASPVCWPMSADSSVATPSSPPEDSVLRVSSSPVSVMADSSPMSCLSVVLLVDASSSVTDDDFDAMKTFTKSLVENLRVSHPGSFVSVVQFNQHPKVEVPLTNVCKTKLSTSIENMEQLMGSTDIAAPIRRARQILAEEAAPGDRAIVLLTDGQTHADELQESEREARKASEEVGARLYTLGVGRDIDEVGLGRVAGGSEAGMHFTLRRLIPSK